MADEDGLAAPFDDYLFFVAIVSVMVIVATFAGNGERASERTFLPSGMAARSISTLACASTSAEADMLTRKSAFEHDLLAIASSYSHTIPHDVLQSPLKRFECLP